VSTKIKPSILPTCSGRPPAAACGWPTPIDTDLIIDAEKDFAVCGEGVNLAAAR